MEETFRELTSHMVTNPGASEGALETLRRSVHHELPDDYMAFLRWSNGAEGDIGVNYISIYSAESVAQNPYPFEEFIPGLLFVGSDGGEALFGFDERIRPMPIMVTHQDDLDLDDIVPLADSFVGFLRFLSAEDWIEYWNDYQRSRRQRPDDGQWSQ